MRFMEPKELRELYYPYHSLDPAQVIERILETKRGGRAGYHCKRRENIARDHETRRKIKPAACVGVRRYRQVGFEKSQIPADNL